WNKIHKALIKAASKHILFKKVNTIKGIKETNSSKHSHLYFHYKEILFLKNHISFNFNILLQNYLSKYPDNTIQNLSPTLFHLKNELHLTKTALNHHQNQITYNE